MTTRRKDLLSASFWVLFAVYVAIESYGFGLGKWSMPGPGYFPFAASLLFVIISLSFLLKTLRQPSSKETRVPTPKESWQNIILTLASMIVYLSLVNRIGFIICTFLFGIFFMRVIASQRWFVVAIVSVSIALGTHLLFNVLLNVQLPRGIFTFLEG